MKNAESLVAVHTHTHTHTHISFILLAIINYSKAFSLTENNKKDIKCSYL